MSRLSSWWRKIWTKVEKWLAGREQDWHVPEPEPPVTPYVPPHPTPSTPNVQIAVSWLSNAAWRQMNELADIIKVTLDTFRRHAEEAVARGENTMNLYLANQRDGRPVPTSFYVGGGFSGEIDPHAVESMRIKVQTALSLGIREINWWLMADDGGIPYRDRGAIDRFIEDVSANFGDLIETTPGYMVIALESNETLRKDDLAHYARTVKLCMPFMDGRVANHMTSGRYDWSRDISAIDCHFHQTAPGKSVSGFESEIRDVARKIGKPVVACEFSLIGVDETARRKAKIALDAGCIGVHSGVPL
jgi:hypothetical protein